MVPNVDSNHHADTVTPVGVSSVAARKATRDKALVTLMKMSSILNVIVSTRGIVTKPSLILEQHLLLY